MRALLAGHWSSGNHDFSGGPGLDEGCRGARVKVSSRSGLRDRRSIPFAPCDQPEKANLNQHDERLRYYPLFDWLRAVAAATVMLAHGGAMPWANAGNFAVQVFFALSGWLIGAILMDLAPRDLPRFFFNRATRIWVPYYLALVLLLSLSILREPMTSKWIEFVIYKLTFVYNLFGTEQLARFQDAMPQKGTLNHVWSVNAEEQFYLIAPWFLVLGARLGGRSPLTWMILVIASIALTPYYIAIVLGVLSAIVVRKWGPLHLSAAGRIAIGLVFAASVAGLVADINYTLIAPITGLCIVLLLAVPGQKTAVGTIAGGMSYPLYLNHWIGFFAAHFLMRHAPFWIATAFSSAVSIGIAVMLYWYVDRQLLLKRRAWYTDRKGYLLTACAYTMIVIGVGYGLSKLGQG